MELWTIRTNPAAEMESISTSVAPAVLSFPFRLALIPPLDPSKAFSLRNPIRRPTNKGSFTRVRSSRTIKLFEATANTRWEKRQAKVLAKAKKRMRKQKNSDKSESYWSNLWSKPRDSQNSDRTRSCHRLSQAELAADFEGKKGKKRH
ncbi:hypothetical protein ACJW30_02G141600 [Castanea mollissima]